MSSRLSRIALLLALVAPVAAAHDAPGSSSFNLLVPDFPLNGSITFVTLVGPPAGEEVLHTTLHLNYVTGAGGTPASDVLIELLLPVDGVWKEWAFTGADLGWPSATGSFSAELGTDALNGVLWGGLFSFSTPDLHIGATTGGLTGQFLNSTFELELAGVCQTDLALGGPGGVTLSVCGKELASGKSAKLKLNGAPPFAPAFLVAGTGAAPAPFKGGTLAPLPLLLVVPVVTDAAGRLLLTVPGGGGPLVFALQAVVVDAAQPFGYALSNAVQVALLP